MDHYILFHFLTLPSIISIMKGISNEKRRVIANALQKGTTVRDVATIANVSLSTVSKYRKLDSLVLNLGRGGRPRKVSDAKKRQIKRHILNGQLTTIVAIYEYLKADSFDVS